MKLPFLIADCQLPIADCGGVRNRKSSIAHRQSRQGMALVITLILLAVTLVMAVAFLAISRRGRNAVTASTDAATARLATDSALAAAQAQIAAGVFANPANNYNFTLLISTNYINTNTVDPTYNTYFDAGGNLLSGTALEQVLANQLILPRVPVFIKTNDLGSNDFRFYLDLNRNGQFEPNGYLVEVDNNNIIIGTNYNATGDPEWIGVLEHPDQPHGPNNHFIARYAFLAQPVGNSLDLNYIHNAARLPLQATFDSLGKDYRRNQGVGSWEINLGAFLTDLNANAYGWDASTYVYDPIGGFVGGNGMADAAWTYSFRLNGLHTLIYTNDFSYNIGVLNSVNNLFGATGANVFGADQIDRYVDGPLQLMNSLPVDNDAADINYPWPGADTANHFFNLPSDLFNIQKTSPNFAIRLLSAATNAATYDRYTFYRMLDQLGTDSTPDAGKMNLNYANVLVLYNANQSPVISAPIQGAETNFVAWQPRDFFVAAADRMLRHYTAQWHDYNFNDFTNTFGVDTTNAFGLTNIPVYVDGRFVYSPAVNRILQLAANLYDASTNKSALPGNNNRDYPSVFRPVFSVVKSGVYRNVYISGYSEVSSSNTFAVGTAPLDQPVEVTDPALATGADYNTPSGNVYGVPWIIGAKKGFPNFNQFYMRNTFQVTRKLQVSRPNGSVPGATTTNQMFTMSITNRIGFSFWNSYESNYDVSPGGMTISFSDNVRMSLANDRVINNGVPGIFDINGNLLPNPAQTNFQVTFFIPYGTPASSWPGSAWSVSETPAREQQSATNTSFFSAYLDYALLPESDFQDSVNNFVASGTGLWDTTNTNVPPFRQFGLMTTNRVQACILDGNHVIDYVQFSGPNGARDLTKEIQDTNRNNGFLMWVTNGGVANQITVSRTANTGGVIGIWKQPPNMPAGANISPATEAAFFNSFFTGGEFSAGQVNSETNVQAPFTPTRTSWEYTLWQANDPLVHYLASDLNTFTRLTGIHHSDNLVASTFSASAPDLKSVTERYQPWGRNNQMAAISGTLHVDASAYNLSYRDPLVWGSDYWDFPTGKYPTVGWIGRVHRGTPWQTVYLKASDIRAVTDQFFPVGMNTWAQWTGDTQTSFGRTFDAAASAPVSDSDLFDLFTARINDNASRGSLSVNQANLAAWSAVFSGVVALTNITDLPASYTTPVITNYFIPPASTAGSGFSIGKLLYGYVAEFADNNNQIVSVPVPGINAIRSRFINSDGMVGAFEHVGDILRVPVLTEQSPFLNWSDPDHRKYDISDEVYEWLPQQVMGLLRVSNTPRYVVYCYGQALRPAANSLVTSGGPNFGLCTNYQVVAESAARAILRVNRFVHTNAPNIVITNYTTTVEGFNTLPPD